MQTKILFWRVENSHGFFRDFTTKEAAQNFARHLDQVTACRCFPVYEAPDFIRREIERLNSR